MISKSKKRINVTLDRALAAQIQEAACEWGLTVSEYIAALARMDLTDGITAHARCMTISIIGRNEDESD